MRGKNKRPKKLVKGEKKWKELQLSKETQRKLR